MDATRLITLAALVLQPLMGQDPLGTLTSQPVRTEPGPTQPVSDSPAISTVITSEELWRAGYRSVAEALRNIAGFYGISDHLGENIGVRGLNPGPRAYSRILKIMVDGQPVAFRPDATTLLGPELIPLEAVHHIEVSRGPTSALYGADAFLGAVNIVTRGFSRAPRASIVARSLLRHGSGGEVMAETGGQDWAFLVAGSYHGLDRSRLAVPLSSPALGDNRPPSSTSGIDRAYPASFFSKVEVRSENLRTEATLHASKLSSDVAWADYTPLVEGSTLRMRQGFLRVLSEWTPVAAWSLVAYVTRAVGRTEPDERLASLDPTLKVRRDMSTQSLDAGLKAHWILAPQTTVALGLDLVRDDHRLMKVIQVDQVSGAEQALSPDRDRLRFENTGLFGQVRTALGEHWDADINLRQDHHSRYGNTFSHRTSLLYRLAHPYYAKVLHGSSYKAPSPAQLFAEPLYPAEILGNPDLTPEHAKTSELELGWEPGQRLQVRVRGFRIQVEGLIVLSSRGTPTPVNLGRQLAKGLECEAKGISGRHQWQATLTLQNSRGEMPSPFLGMTESPGGLFPQRLATVTWTVRMGSQASATMTARAAGPRRASDSNILYNHERPYTLPGYLTLHLATQMNRGPWSFGLRVDDLLDHRPAEPGFRGFDIPSLGRMIQLSAAWRL